MHARLLRHGRISGGGGGGGLPVLLSGPYFVASPLDTTTPVSAVVVGQKQFIVANFSNSPTTYTWAVYDNSTNDLLDSDTGMVAPGDDYWLPGSELAGITVRLEVIANNGSGDSAVASATMPVQGVDLSGAAPLLTRASSSGASPFTVTQGAFASSVFEGYLEQRAISTSNAVDPADGSFVTTVYDETVILDSSSIAAPGTIPWPTFDDSGYTQLYEKRRVLSNPDADATVLSPWSNMVKKSDALTNTTAYSKYRVRTTNTATGFATIIAEFKVAATPGGADTANNSGVTISGTSSADTNPASNARDGNPATYWSCNLAAPNTTAFPHDLTLDYSGGTPIAANEFKITANLGTGAPRDFTIDGWNGSAWTALVTGTAVIWTNGETKTYVL